MSFGGGGEGSVGVPAHGHTDAAGDGGSDVAIWSIINA